MFACSVNSSKTKAICGHRGMAVSALLLSSEHNAASWRMRRNKFHVRKWHQSCSVCRPVWFTCAWPVLCDALPAVCLFINSHRLPVLIACFYLFMHLSSQWVGRSTSQPAHFRCKFVCLSSSQSVKILSSRISIQVLPRFGAIKLYPQKRVFWTGGRYGICELL